MVTPACPCEVPCGFQPAQQTSSPFRNKGRLLNSVVNQTLLPTCTEPDDGQPVKALHFQLGHIRVRDGMRCVKPVPCHRSCLGDTTPRRQSGLLSTMRSTNTPVTSLPAHSIDMLKHIFTLDSARPFVEGQPQRERSLPAGQCRRQAGPVGGS